VICLCSVIVGAGHISVAQKSSPSGIGVSAWGGGVACASMAPPRRASTSMCALTCSLQGSLTLQVMRFCCALKSCCPCSTRLSATSSAAAKACGPFTPR
jgi:hypothetical protein